MSPEFWGGIAGVAIFNAATVIYCYGKLVGRVDGLEKLIGAELEAVKSRVTRLETFVDNRRAATAARGGV